ncbi:MAG: Ig-like domain-containing protein [Clostridia bacterium]|nr:Ig-like domain-containing protein [Clostridia bacterium]
MEKKKKKKTGIIIAVILVLLLIAALALFVIIANPFASTCKVTFDPQGGKMEVTEVTVAKGQAAREPEPPVLDGYVFKSWQLNGTDYIFTTPVKKNIKLVATYVERVEITSISFAQKKYTIIEGETIPVAVQFSPADGTDAIEVTVEDPTLAELLVEEGEYKVTALKGGTTRLVAKVNELTAYSDLEILPNAESIELDTEKLEIGVGETQQLTVTFHPDNVANKTLTWRVENEEIATVDLEGNVKGIKEGSTKLSVTTSNGKTAKCDVVVSEIKIESLTLNKGKLDLEGGQTYKLVAKILPEKAQNIEVTWTSSDEKVATVDKTGLVTAVAGGTAKITAQSPEGVKAECEVNVLIYPTSIRFQGNSTVYYVDVDGTVDLTSRIIFEPENCNARNLTFKTNSSDITVDANGIVKAKSFSNSGISVTITTENGKSAVADVYTNGSALSYSVSKTPAITEDMPGFNVSTLGNNHGGVPTVISRQNTIEPVYKKLNDGEFTIKFAESKTGSNWTDTIYGVKQGEGPGNRTTVFLPNAESAFASMSTTKTCYYRIECTVNGKTYYSDGHKFVIEPAVRVSVQNNPSIVMNKSGSIYIVHVPGNVNDQKDITFSFSYPVDVACSSSHVSLVSGGSNTSSATVRYTIKQYEPAIVKLTSPNGQVVTLQLSWKNQ